MQGERSFKSRIKQQLLFFFFFLMGHKISFTRIRHHTFGVFTRTDKMPLPKILPPSGSAAPPDGDGLPNIKQGRI